MQADLGRLIQDGMRMFFSRSLAMSEAMQEWSRDMFRTAVLVESGQTASLTRTLSEGTQYILVATQLHAVAEIHVKEGAPTEQTFEFLDAHVAPQRVLLGPGEVTLRCVNRAEEPELVVGFGGFPEEDDGPDAAMLLEDGPTPEEGPGADWLTWRPTLTGKRLLTTQSFRELFRAETLPPDASLELQSLAILFTDLKASTQLYEHIGDLEALRLVREHFKLLRDVVAEEEGAVVKTIGDAVMATFSETPLAVRAGARMHHALEKLAGPAELQLKVGVHTGPVVAIDSNERLDYFGQTVNIAARVQGLADGRELVCTDAVLASPGVREVVATLGLVLRREEALLKGIDQPVVVHRGAVQ
jgi:class 3 adenylate cyclase